MTALVMFLFGRRRIACPREGAALFLELCMRSSISYRAPRWEEDGSFSILCPSLTAGRLLILCGECGLAAEVRETGGFPTLLRQYCRRLGLALGSLLIAVMLFLSGRVIWDVRIVGNETLTDSQILGELEACGLRVGSYIPDLNMGELENRVLLASDSISWISIYIDGTVAVVQVLEHRSGAPSEVGKNPANLVAAADGQIELLQLYRGAPVVKIGQAVKAGELLVSGLYDSASGGYRYTRAAGRVLARTEHRFSVEIPLVVEEKVYGESRIVDGTLNFFGFSIIFFKNYRNLPAEYDIIKVEKSFWISGQAALPFSIQLSTCLPYETERKERTPEAALETAYLELERQLALLATDAQLLQKNLTTTLTDTALLLQCEVLCIEDIAKVLEFEIVE